MDCRIHQRIATAHGWRSVGFALDAPNHKEKRMNKKLISLAAAVLFAIPIAQFAARPSVAVAAEEKKVEKSELHGHMEDIDDLLKKLRKTCRKAESNEESLKLITEIQELMVKSKALTPTRAAKVP